MDLNNHSQSLADDGSESLELLLVADDDQERRRIREQLEALPRNIVVHEAVTARGATEALARRQFDCAIVDSRLSDGTGRQLIEGVATLPGWERRSTPFVLMGDQMTTDAHAFDAAVKSGAEDLLPKRGLDGLGLLRSIRFAIERQRTRRIIDDANDRLDRLVTLDPLTELPNRRAFERVLRARAIDAVESITSPGIPGYDELDALPHRPVIVLVDVDDLRVVNERFGMEVGDEALRAIARSLERSLPVGSYLARVGGDEFAALLPPNQTGNALVAGENVRMAVASLDLRRRNSAIPLTVSVGCAVVPEHASLLSSVLGFAQRALDRSKFSGKNRVTLADLPVAGEPVPSDRGRTVTVDSATFEPTNLHTWRQPIVRLSDGESVGFEFCTRGQEGKLESPLDLLLAAAARDDLATVDLRFLRRAVLQAARLPGRLRSHLNVRAATLMEVPPEVVYQALLAGPEPDNVYLELEVRDLPDDLDDLALRMAALRRGGIEFVLDGVGGGGTSLEALIALEPEWIGLSRGVSFRGLGKLLAIVERIGCHVVAKGVETPEQASRFADAGVRLAQGWFFGRPEACD